MTHPTFDIKKSKKNIKIAIIFRGRGFDPFDPGLLSIKLDVVLSLNGLEVSALSHCIILLLCAETQFATGCTVASCPAQKPKTAINKYIKQKKKKTFP
uniref:SFRICE_028359 n=1 Tax=Spodoptera frugiperda TaxID=7108 RepID=A0A2H1WGT3_SPOFR